MRPRRLHGSGLDDFSGLGRDLSGPVRRDLGVSLGSLLLGGGAGGGAQRQGGDSSEGEGLDAHEKSPFSVEPWR